MKKSKFNIKVVRRPKPQLPKNKHEMIWKVINSDQQLIQYFNPNHPVFEYTFLNLGDSLSFRVGFKNGRLPHQVTGVAQIFDLMSSRSDTFLHRRFHAGFMATLNTLLFEEVGRETVQEREEMKLFTPDLKLDWDQVTAYIELACAPLPFQVNVVDTGEILVIHLYHTDDEWDCTASKYPIHKPTEEGGYESMNTELQSYLFAGVNDRTRELLEASKYLKLNDSLKERLKISITRAIHQTVSMSEYERLKAIQDVSPETRLNMDEAKRLAMTLRDG